MALSQHLSAKELQGFPMMSVGERRALLRHLCACRSCSKDAAELWGMEQPPVPSITSVSLSAVLERVELTETLLSKERAAASALFEELRPHPPARRQTMVRNSRRFNTWGFAELLVAKSRDAVFEEPAQAISFAELACDVSGNLQGGRYGDALVADLRGRSWTALGNARRVSSDLRGAEEAFQAAEAMLEQGTGDPIESAHLDYCRAALRGYQRRFQEALRFIDRSIRTYRRIGDRHLEGRAVVVKAATLAKAGEIEESIRLQQAALPLIDEQRDPRVMLAAHHNLAIDLVNTGRATEALELLDQYRPLYEKVGNRMVFIRLRWVEGEAAQALGQYDRAEAAYLEVRDALASREIPYDAAVASLQLATLYAEQGRTGEIRQLAAEMLPIFQALEIQRETIAALMLFRQAAEAETATLALIQHIAGFLKRAQHDPAARFSAPN